MSKAKKTCPLTPEQQGSVVNLARHFINFAERHGGLIANASGEEWTPREYANKVLRDLAIDAQFKPPKTGGKR